MPLRERGEVQRRHDSGSCTGVGEEDASLDFRLTWSADALFPRSCDAALVDDEHLVGEGFGLIHRMQSSAAW